MTIQISPKLLNEISEHIDELAKTAIRSQFGSPNDDMPLHICGKDTAIADRIFWKEHLHFREKLPSSWVVRLQKPSYTEFRNPIDNQEFPGVMLRFNLLTDGSTYIAPPNTNSYKPSFTLSKESSETDPILGPVVRELRERCAVEIRWKETKTKVQEFLKTCRSLNQAVKLWPELVNFLPTERRKRLEEENKPKTKKERTTPAPEEVLGQINRDAIAGDLVALRFATN